ncbi:helix-turn-helix domain-containing protein [Aquimarina brevivitae]|uniref:Helix-turn-helix protein n=1 Tax=Aquimarina brevivitae TaxID=323412 RepID=A0A4Q7PG80_9FLAO|nr:helix-turn-helix domain-containing protein [Aquimarina brevivitae]RZS99501.1 helix-turn-helix protein [Aquimarina brevivitae]
MTLSFVDIINIVGITLSFVLALLILFSKFFRSTTNQYLGFTILIIAIIGLNNWFWDINKHPKIISLLDIPLWQFLYPVTLFMFFYKSAKGNWIASSWYKLLFIPFVVLSLLNGIITFQNIFKLYSLPILTQEVVTTFYKGISLLTAIFPITMMLLSVPLVFSKVKRDAAKWLRWIWTGMTFLIVYGLFLEAGRFFTNQKMSLQVLWVFVTLFISWMSYLGLYKFKLSNDRYQIRLLHRSESQKQTKKGNSYFNEIIRLLSEDKLYRDPNLTRDTLAERLGISAGYVSQIITAETKDNFTSLINQYRIEDVQYMLTNPEFDQYSIVAIGLEAGFSSKTTFFQAFKKATGYTPNAYKKEQRGSDL